MTKPGVEQTKSIAGWALTIVAIHFLYSFFEVFRHAIIGGAGVHIVEHLATGILSFVILVAGRNAVIELLNEKIKGREAK